MQNYICASIIGVAIVGAGWLVRDGISNSSENIAAYGDATLPGFFHVKGGKIRNCTTWPASQEEEPVVIGVNKGTTRFYLRCSDWDDGRIGVETKDGVIKLNIPFDRGLSEVFDRADEAAKASAGGK